MIKTGLSPIIIFFLIFSVFQVGCLHACAGVSYAGTGDIIDVQEQSQSGKIFMTAGEYAWVRAHPVIRLGFDPEFAPFEFLSPAGKYRGAAADYAKLVANRIGVRFEPVTGLAWKIVIKEAVKKNIDILPCVGIIKSRKSFIEFSDPYLFFPRVVVTRKNTRIKGPDQLAHLRVGVQVQSSHAGFLKEKTRISPVLFPTFRHALLALSRGTIDAVVGNLAVATYEIGNLALSNLKIADYLSREPIPLAFGIRNDWPVLKNLVNRALKSITLREKARIQEKWFPVESTIPESSPDLSWFRETLPSQEKQWLADHPLIRVCSDPFWAPVEFRNKKGKFAGIAVEYLRILEKHLGIHFVIQDISAWSSGLDLVRQGKMDLLSAVMYTRSRKDSLVFTSPYLEIPAAIFTGTGMPYIGSLSELNGKRVGVVKGYAIEELIREDYPGLVLVPVKTTEDGLGLLEKQKIQAFVGGILTTGYYIGKLKNTSLKVAGETPYTIRLSMAVRRELAPLADIIEKCLARFPESEKNRIYRKWISIQYDHGTDFSLLFKVLVPVVFLFLLFIYWVRRLKQEIYHRQMTEKALVQARKEAEQANQTKTIFLANMSHEIRTPLNAILGYSQLLVRDTNLTSEQKESLQTINKSGEHLLGLINDILEISKIEAGKHTLEPKVFDLFRLLSDLDLMFRMKTNEKGLAFEITKPGDSVRFVLGDEGKICQVLINLLGNAVKFTSRGHVFLTVNVRNVSDEPGNSGQTDQRIILEFVIEDTGKGMSDEDLEKIFNSFEQAEPDATTGGTGLGLAISREYARLMEGDIHVKSRRGHGSVFTFFCAVRSGSPDSCGQELIRKTFKALKPGEKSVHVLVADDSRVNRALLRKILTAKGFKVMEAMNGKEAVDLFCDRKPGIILMDLVMPGLNGLDAIRKIRQLPGGDQVLIIAVTASVMKEDRETVLKAGADHFLGKPFREEELFSMIEECPGVEFFYEASSPSVKPGRTDSYKKLDHIPEPIYDNMIKALELGHIKTIHGVIQSIYPHDSGLALTLKKLADAYDFNAIRQIFKPRDADR